MKNYRTISLAINGLSFALILTKTQLVSSIFYFLLFGAIPGTSLSIPSLGMFAACTLAISTVCVYFIMLISHFFQDQQSTQRPSPRQLPRRRYARPA